MSPSILNHHSLGLGAGGYRGYILSLGPIAYWRLNDPATLATEDDETGNGRTLTWTPESSHVYSSERPAGVADAGSAYLSTGNGATTGSTLAFGPAAFSFACWIRTPPDFRASLWGSGGYTEAGVRYRSIMSLAMTSGRWDMQMRAPVANSEVSGIEIYARPWLTQTYREFPALLLAETWHHVAYTITSAGSMIVYLDGGPLGAPIAGSAASPDAHSFRLGTSVLSQPWNGFWSEVALWNRALTATEVATLYGLGAGLL